MDTGNTRKPMKRKIVNPVEDVEMSGQQAKEKRVTPPQRRHHGLINQGATCYLNSVLQVLFMTTEIHHRLDSKYRKDVHLRKIFEGLKETTCGTENITATFGIKNGNESDAAECLKMILHHISPEASEFFRGQLTITKKCSKGHILNVKTETFWTMSVSLSDTPDTTNSVQNSFESNFQTKKGDKMVYCCECNKITEATIRCEMVKAPQILILHLKRFDSDYITRSHFKSDRCVEVPCELQSEDKAYKLYGMVNHMGSIRGGHYTATVLSEDNTWYECDDHHVSEVRHQPFARARTFRYSWGVGLPTIMRDLPSSVHHMLSPHVLFYTNNNKLLFISSKTVYLLTYRALHGHYHGLSQGDTNDLTLLSWKDTHDANYSESSAKKMITEHKVELINCLKADQSLILQHSHSKQIITDNQYFNIKEKSPSTPQETVIDLIDHVILNGQKSCTLLLKVLKLPEVLSTYPQLKEILNEMQLSNGGSNA